MTGRVSSYQPYVAPGVQCRTASFVQIRRFNP